MVLRVAFDKLATSSKDRGFHLDVTSTSVTI